MEQGLVSPGQKVHIITRRNFAEDLRRHFAGTVEAADGTAVRVHGYTFVFDANALKYRRRPEVRTRIFDLGDAQLIVNLIPADVEIADLDYTTVDDRLVITDSKRFRLDVNEFGATH